MICKYEGCNSPFASGDESKDGHGYCYGHAMELGLVKPKDKKKRDEKIKKSHQEIQETKEVVSGVEKKVKQTLHEKKQESIEAATKVYEDIVGNDTFHLDKIVQQALDDGHTLSQENKNLFVMWWVSETDNRTPNSLKRVADILGVSEFKINSWLSEPWFIEAIDEYRLLRMKIVAPFIDRINLIQAIAGDGKAKDLLYRQIGQLGTAVKSDDPYGDATDAELAEAEEISGLLETKSHTLRTSPEEEAISERMSSVLPIDKRGAGGSHK